MSRSLRIPAFTGNEALGILVTRRRLSNSKTAFVSYQVFFGLVLTGYFFRLGNTAGALKFLTGSPPCSLIYYICWCRRATLTVTDAPQQPGIWQASIKASGSSTFMPVPRTTIAFKFWNPYSPHRTVRQRMILVQYTGEFQILSSGPCRRPYFIVSSAYRWPQTRFCPTVHRLSAFDLIIAYKRKLVYLRPSIWRAVPTCVFQFGPSSSELMQQWFRLGDLVTTL